MSRPDRYVRIPPEFDATPPFTNGRRLRFNHSSICEFEEASGSPFILLVQDPNRLQAVRVQSLLLWAGLLHEDPTLTMAKVNGLMDQYIDSKGGAGRVEIMGLVMKALEVSEVLGAGGKDQPAAPQAAPAAPVVVEQKD